jgi:hypothetical protein
MGIQLENHERCICSALGHMAPCPWCESLTEKEVAILDKYGYTKAVGMINKSRLEEPCRRGRTAVIVFIVVMILVVTLIYSVCR